ncbi:MAG TPA: sensor histidine kinase [Nocardioidaceae bacterium]
MSSVDASRPLQHDAVFYDDDSVFMAAALPFIREGVQRGEVVMLNTVTHPLTPMLRAMFHGEDQVVIADRAVYSTPAAALDGYRRTMERGLAEGAAGYRAIGYIDFDGSHLPWQEWVKYEAAVNHVFRNFPFRTICPYDVAELPSEIVAPMKRAHTGLYGPDGWRRNEEYVDPGRLLADDTLAAPPHPVQSGPPRMVLEPSDDLTGLRMELYAATMFTDLSPRRIDDFVSAVGEVVTNAHRHVGEPVRLQLWAADAAVVCTVTDQGPGIEDPLVGFGRPRHPSEGLGLWAARQLVDVLDFRRGPDGFTVRVASFL